MPIRLLDLLEVPTPVPTRGGLLSVATVHDSPNNEFLHQIGYVQGSTCEVPKQAPYDCYSNIPITDADKASHGIFADETTVFSLYFAVDCTLQSDEGEFERRAREGLEAGESTGIEVIAQTLLNGISNTATATGIVDAIGKAEVWAGNNWGHLPVIHLDRNQTTKGIAEHVIVPGLDWSLTTGQGTPVDNAGGFVAANTLWVTGAVSVMRGPVKTYRAIDPLHNHEMALAERSYALWIDCGGLKITIS